MVTCDPTAYGSDSEHCGPTHFPEHGAVIRPQPVPAPTRRWRHTPRSADRCQRARSRRVTPRACCPPTQRCRRLPCS
eukprot:scaffold32837_cov129-Isochrysis_galbana.AAC.3